MEPMNTTTAPMKKIDMLRSHMVAGDWRAAISLAAKFPRLGAIRCAVLDAHMAITNPRFTAQIGKDPAALIEAGRQALAAEYGLN